MPRRNLPFFCAPRVTHQPFHLPARQVGQAGGKEKGRRSGRGGDCKGCRELEISEERWDRGLAGAWGPMGIRACVGG